MKLLLLYKLSIKMYNDYMLTVKEVKKSAYFYDANILPGDQIIAFDGYEVEDVLDYDYYDTFCKFTVTINRGGKEFTISVNKDDSQSLNLVFESDNLDVKTCRNKCIFCFVDQMPKGMRPSLYVKDDDYRQSFLCGNFVTLTNVTDKQIDRIIRLKLSPLYVSVQTMNGELRKEMLGNRFAGDIFDKLKKLTDGGIKIDTQIVVVPGVNDGKELEYSIRELHKLRPYLQSVAVVPCGITKYRDGLFDIKDITKGYAECVIEWVNILNAEFNEPFVQAGDEFYFKAQKPIPDKNYYGEFSQVGNGVGMTAKFKMELKKSLKKKNKSGKFLIVTGESAGEFIKEQASLVKKYCQGITVNVLPVKNEFFGDTVNCVGLLTGNDIIRAVNNFKGEFDSVILPCLCLKADEDVFLDDVTLKELKEKLNKKIIITDGSGQSFFDALTGGNNVRIVK